MGLGSGRNRWQVSNSSMISGLILAHLSRGRKACVWLSFLSRLKEEGWAWQDRETRSADRDEGSFRCGCYRAVDWPTAALVLAPLRPSGVGGGGGEAVSECFWGLWGVCVPDASFPHLRCNDESQGEGASGWACVDCTMGTLSLRGREEEWGQHAGDLEFWGGSSIVLPLGPFQSLYSSQGYSLGTIWGASLINGNRTGQQWPHWTSAPSAWICPLSPPGLPFLLPPFP